jgi:hypothetical protein
VDAASRSRAEALRDAHAPGLAARRLRLETRLMHVLWNRMRVARG